MAKKIEFHFKSPEDSPGYLLGQLEILRQRKLKKVLDPLDLTITQFVMLAAVGWLSRDNDAVTQIDIANQSSADRMMVSKVLRTLEEKKFITRQEHPTDTRAKVIKLSPAGESVLQKALISVETSDVDFFSVLDPTDLKILNANISKLLAAHSS